MIAPPYRANATQELMRVAQGLAPADRVVVNAKLLNVYTGELLPRRAVAIKGAWIAYVGPDAGHTLGDRTEVIDADGQTVIPGLIDGHTHLCWLFTPAEFLRFAMGGGTTTIVTETFETYPVAGYPGLLDFLAALRDQPVKIFATAPPMISISPPSQGIAPHDLERLLAREEILGLGETYWQALLQAPERLVPLLDATRAAGKTLEGHSAGASEKKLNAYVAAGISSCHEPVKAGEVLDRLRLGVHVMAREGSIRRDLQAIAAIAAEAVDLRRLILVSDGVAPQDLLADGYMEFIVRKAIACGFDPVQAVRMATLNVAEHFRLDHLIGGIAPGRYADLLIVPDLRDLRAACVISNGRVIARDGRPLVAPRPHAFSAASLNSIRLAADLPPEAFCLTADTPAKSVTVRTIEMVTDLVTRKVELQLPVRDGRLRIDRHPELARIAAVDRTREPGKTFVGLIKDFGLQEGALACSAAWDTSDIVVVGKAEHDMALAVNRIRALHGGAVFCRDGRVVAELALPIFGIMSPEPLETTARDIQAVNAAAAAAGIRFPDPLLSLIALTGAAIPFYRICEEGLVDFKGGRPHAAVVTPPPPPGPDTP